MQISRWIKPGTNEVRYYISTRFGGFPFLNFSQNSKINGMWIGEFEGKAKIMHKAQYGAGRAWENAIGLDECFGLSSWEAWETAFNVCQTKSGNFSVAKFMKYEPAGK